MLAYHYAIGIQVRHAKIRMPAHHFVKDRNRQKQEGTLGHVIGVASVEMCGNEVHGVQAGGVQRAVTCSEEVVPPLERVRLDAGSAARCSTWRAQAQTQPFCSLQWQGRT